MKNITIITEANIEMGMGHVKRMLCLAQSLRKDCRITFLTQSGNIVRQYIQDYGFDVLPVHHSYEKTLSALGGYHTLIIDCLDVDTRLASWAKINTKARIVIFGNLSGANRHADVVVNAVIGVNNFKNSKYRDPRTNTLYLEGPRYIILGEPFRNNRNSYCYRGTMEKILLTFGGSDQTNLTCRIAQQLMLRNAKVEITICVGLLYPYQHELSSLRQVVAKNNLCLNIIINSTRIHDLMMETDYVLTSPGNSLFEAMTLGVPAIAFFQSKKQACMFRGFPLTYEQEDIDRICELVVDVYENYSGYQNQVQGLDIGGGYEEITNIIYKMAF